MGVGKLECDPRFLDPPPANSSNFSPTDELIQKGMEKLIIQPATSEEVEPINAKHPVTAVAEDKEVVETNDALACLLDALTKVAKNGGYTGSFTVLPEVTVPEIPEGEEVFKEVVFPVPEAVEGEPDQEEEAAVSSNPTADIPNECVACECPLRRSAYRDVRKIGVGKWC